MCKCIEQINDAFERAGKNTVLTVPIAINIKTGTVAGPRVEIGVEKRESKKRERPVRIQPTYCPFCGVKYEEQEPS